MNILNTQHKKYQQRTLKENAICCMAGLSCFVVLLYAFFLLQPFAIKVLEHLNGAVQVMNNVLRGGF